MGGKGKKGRGAWLDDGGAPWLMLEDPRSRSAWDSADGDEAGEGARLAPPPPPAQSAQYAAAKQVADFPAYINGFISGGFRTTCIIGTCFRGGECHSRAEDKRSGGSGKAKQIPVYSSPEKEYHCAPCWEDTIETTRAQKRNALNRKKRGKAPSGEEWEVKEGETDSDRQ